jgi:hypothetical protein
MDRYFSWRAQTAILFKLVLGGMPSYAASMAKRGKFAAQLAVLLRRFASNEENLEGLLNGVVGSAVELGELMSRSKAHYVVSMSADLNGSIFHGVRYNPKWMTLERTPNQPKKPGMVDLVVSPAVLVVREPDGVVHSKPRVLVQPQVVVR